MSRPYSHPRNVLHIKNLMRIVTSLCELIYTEGSALQITFPYAAGGLLMRGGLLIGKETIECYAMH